MGAAEREFTLGLGVENRKNTKSSNIGSEL